MNPAKLLEDVLVILRRYSPILVVHILLLLWLSARVLDTRSMSEHTTIWAIITAQINSGLNAIGLSLQLWYVLTALVIGYMALFEWVRSLVTKVPVLRIRYNVYYDANLLGYAAQILQMKPDPLKVSESLDGLIDQYDKELRETNQRHPYQWQFDREHTYLSYYGTLLVILGASIAWGIQGGTMARSPAHVWRLAFLIGFIGFAVRWRTARVIAYGRNQLGYWALREFRRRTKSDREDPLKHERLLWLVKQAKYLVAAKRDPAMILRSLVYRLPQRFHRQLGERLRLPIDWKLGDDWDILASQNMKHQDENHVPPAALRVDGLEKQFAGLLECPGAGLCILAPWQLGLAPAVPGGGASYSFAERKHGGYLRALALMCNNDRTHHELTVNAYGPNKAFLVEVGNHPIELLAQRDFPTDGRHWYSLTDPKFDENSWPSYADGCDKLIDNIAISCRLPMHPGSTYLMRAKTHSAQALVVFQCFRVQGTAKILVAWRILDVFLSEEKTPEVLAWWNPQAWKDLWRLKN